MADKNTLQNARFSVKRFYLLAATEAPCSFRNVFFQPVLNLNVLRKFILMKEISNEIYLTFPAKTA